MLELLLFREVQLIALTICYFPSMLSVNHLFRNIQERQDAMSKFWREFKCGR